MSAGDGWYLMMFAFGLMCAWAVVTGFSDGDL